LALVVVGYCVSISHSVQPMVARNYLSCGIYSFDGFSEAKFKVAHYLQERLLALKAGAAYDAVSAVFREFPPLVSLERSDEEGRVRPRRSRARAEKDWA
jgi:hypothetical protein